MGSKRSRSIARNDKLQRVAAELFLKQGYDGVTVDKIVELAGGSKSTVYSEFGGKCGLFISSIENLCRDFNEPLAKIDYTGLSLEESLKKLASHILRLITSKRAVELHRLAISEALHCPEVGQAWYIHGPARTASFIQALLDERKRELQGITVPVERLAVILHDSLTGDVLYKLLAGVSGPYSDDTLSRIASEIVELVLCGRRKKKQRSKPG